MCSFYHLQIAAGEELFYNYYSDTQGQPIHPIPKDELMSSPWLALDMSKGQ